MIARHVPFFALAARSAAPLLFVSAIAAGAQPTPESGHGQGHNGGAVNDMANCPHAPATASPESATTKAAPKVPAATPYREPGQAIFAALREAIADLEADPDTDWAAVDLGALREHLVMMDRVFAEARVESKPLVVSRSRAGGATAATEIFGMRYHVRGTDEVRAAALTMSRGHAAALQAERPWTVMVHETGDEIVVEVSAGDPVEVAKIRALGFFGFLTVGDHHGAHHAAIARGSAEHAHSMGGHAGHPPAHEHHR